MSGCLLGGAVGDALGAAVEFMSIDAIRRKYGEQGIADYDYAYGRRGAITDDTQMTLFTAEGMLRAIVGAANMESAIRHRSSITHTSSGCTRRAVNRNPGSTILRSLTGG